MGRHINRLLQLHNSQHACSSSISSRTRGLAYAVKHSLATATAGNREVIPAMRMSSTGGAPAGQFGSSSWQACSLLRPQLVTSSSSSRGGSNSKPVAEVASAAVA